jgi:hypothetical protein
MAKSDPTGDRELEATKRLMGALVRRPPKPHDEMKLREPKARAAKNARQKHVSGASAKPKSA